VAGIEMASKRDPVHRPLSPTLRQLKRDRKVGAQSIIKWLEKD
jgi:hypothetical protein